MGLFSLLDVGVLLLAAITAAGIVFALSLHFAPPRRTTLGEMSAASFARVFLFEGETLSEATPAAEELLRSGNAELDDWPRLMSALGRSFRSIEASLSSIKDLGFHSELSSDGRWKLEAEWIDGITRIVVDPQIATSTPPTVAATAAIAPLVDELETLRQVVNDLPVLAWRENAEGEIVWANAAYINMAARASDDNDALRWPLPRLFETHLGKNDISEETRRVSTRIPGEETIHWYECITQRSGDDAMVFALPANRLVRAEASLREFIQTLTQTFAHLPAAIAIFDKNRRLALFNPALTDLSNLEVDFLSARPTLYAFLDRLREKRRMPEPKNYKSWRQRISDLEQAAATGTHEETWTLPTGQTYRVVGRPHPGGAVAFLFEDISAEITLTRRFRSELELAQTIVDSLDEGLAVFSPGGILVQSNRRYNEIWGQDPSEVFGEISIIEATRNWQAVSEPTPIWGEARCFVTEPSDREEWTAEVKLLRGPRLHLRLIPITGGATLILFQQALIDERPLLPAAEAVTA